MRCKQPSKKQWSYMMLELNSSYHYLICRGGELGSLIFNLQLDSHSTLHDASLLMHPKSCQASKFPDAIIGLQVSFGTHTFEAPSSWWWHPWAPKWSGSNSFLASQPCEQPPCHLFSSWSHRWCYCSCSSGWAWCRWENSWLLASSCSSHPKASFLVEDTCWTCGLLCGT